MRTMNILFAVLLALGFFYAPGAAAQGRPGGPPGGRMAGGIISGVVQDADTGGPVPTATIAVWSAADSALVTGTVAADDGGFQVEGIRPGRYYIKVSFVGYETRRVDDVSVSPRSPQVDLGEIALSTSTATMDEVQVTAERSFMEVGIDRTVYNTKDQLVSAGGNAAEVLGNIPSVEVDIDGNVSLRGSQNVAILINGKPSPMRGAALTSFLQGLSSDAIERVEVIPNPSAKYEPDGMAGILNIVLKQDRDLGLSGGVSASAQTDNSYNGSFNVNYGKGPVTLTASYGFRIGNRDGSGTLFRENRLLDPITMLDQNSFDDRNMLSHNLNTSLDYKLSKQNSLSLSALVSRRGSDTERRIAYTQLDALKQRTGRFDRLTEGEGDGLNMDYRLSFQRVIDPSKHELTAELRYNTNWGDDLQRFTSTVFDQPDDVEGTLMSRQNNDQDEHNQEGSLQVDYTRPLGEDGKLEAGYKGSAERLHSDFFSETFDPDHGGFVPDDHLNNTFDYDQQIHAAYGIVGGELGRFGLQAGVRLEQAFTTFELKTTNESFTNNYFSVFPSAFATYELSDATSFKLSYSKRINRPRTGGWFNQLNPFNTNEDPFFRRVGNPYLKPEYVHSFEAGFTQLLGKTTLTVTPYFRRTVDVIRFVETIDEQGVTTLTFKNLDTSDSWGAETIGSLQLGRRLNAFVNLNLYKVVTDGSNVDADLSNNAVGFSTRANATINLMSGFDLQLSYFYRAPMNIEGGRIDAFTAADVALRKKLLDDKASLSLRARDIFNTMGFHLWRDTDRFFQETNRSFNAQQVGLTFTYNFGQPARNNRRRGPRPDGEGGGGGGGDIEMMQ